MVLVEPIPGEPAAVADADGVRTLVVADYHAGIENALRYEQGVELDSNATERRERVLSMLAESDAEQLLFLGDIAYSVGQAKGVEREEIETLMDELTSRVPVSLVKGNHDGVIEPILGPEVQVHPSEGVRIGDVGFTHGHTWPSREVLAADAICIGHEHPQIRLEDTVGGSRVERVWLRGSLERKPFARYYSDDIEWNDPELVVFPAYNDLSGGTWVNVTGQEFLSPFLPHALPDGEAYLLDGTRLGRYRDV